MREASWFATPVFCLTKKMQVRDLFDGGTVSAKT